VATPTLNVRLTGIDPALLLGSHTVVVEVMVRPSGKAWVVVVQVRGMVAEREGSRAIEGVVGRWKKKDLRGSESNCFSRNCSVQYKVAQINGGQQHRRGGSQMRCGCPLARTSTSTSTEVVQPQFA